MRRTMDRPRDLIRALKCCAAYEAGSKLSDQAVYASLADYGEWLYRELGNEIFRALPGWREAFGLLQGPPGSGFLVGIWRGRFQSNAKLREGYNADDVLQTLYEFSVVGMRISKGTKTPVFKYNNPQILFNIGARFAVHTGLERYLAILNPTAPCPSIYGKRKSAKK